MIFSGVKKVAIKTISKEKIAALSAIILGSAIVLFIGFADSPAVHNAAHDTRHAAAFPCH